MKRLLFWAAALCLLLTGCGDNTAVSPPSDTTTTISTTTTAATTTTEATTTTTAITAVSGSLSVVTTQPNAPDGFALTDEQVASLDTLIASYEGTVAVGYYDITSGYRYTFNGEHSFPAASVIKAPFCRYVLGMAEQNGLDLSAEMTYTEDMYVGGTGTIKDAEFGTVYTQEELIKLAIRKSDNIAFKMLRQVYPATGFKQYAKAIGITDITGIKNISSSNINAVNAITYMQDIYSYITGDNQYGKTLETHMRSTVNPMIRSKYPVVRKYGWMEGAYHDMAIIKAPRPYILVILSDHDEGSDEDEEMFRVISEAVESVSGN